MPLILRVGQSIFQSNGSVNHWRQSPTVRLRKELCSRRRKLTSADRGVRGGNTNGFHAFIKWQLHR